MIDIGGRLELLVDDFLIDRTAGVSLQLHKPTPREIVLEHREPCVQDDRARTLERIVICLTFTCLISAMTPAGRSSAGNLSAKGFDRSGSDERAIAIADAVMARMGGWKNWDQTRYITWKFFGRRRHVWDKWTGRLRFEEDDRVTLMNIHTRKGRVWRGGVEITEPDSLKRYLDRGYRAWINDSYWLVMPYKLKDPGVTLEYNGESRMENGRAAHVLTLTFTEVGVTPENRYDVYVDKEGMRVSEWAFYRNASDPKPKFRTPWADWKRYGKILLSADRGHRRHTDLAVFDDLPSSVFDNPEPVDIMKLEGRAR